MNAITIQILFCHCACARGVLCDVLFSFFLAGLQLKHNEKLLTCFTFASAPTADVISPLYDKVLVVDEEVEGDHIVVHQLNHTHKLSEVIHPYRQHQYTKAVVVLNTNNSLTLEPFHLEGFRGIGFPVLIISQSDGKALLDITNENDHIFCDVLTADSMKHQQQQLPPISGSGAGSGGKNIFMFITKYGST